MSLSTGEKGQVPVKLNNIQQIEIKIMAKKTKDNQMTQEQYNEIIKAGSYDLKRSTADSMKAVKEGKLSVDKGLENIANIALQIFLL